MIAAPTITPQQDDDQPVPPLIGHAGPAGHSAARPSASGTRADIQGLRALAVGLVIANHLFGWPSGGFVGVDVFFVLSGYLITNLLLREVDRNGRVSWLDFYRRRIRRILPGALVVLVATVGFSYYIYPAARAHAILDDGASALVFLSNWHFAAVGTDYFGNEFLSSPLQHFWSLAVEEQFYVVWPVLIIVVGLIAHRKLLRPVLTGLLVLLVAGIFVYALWQSADYPTDAYFSTLSRAWELGIGALLASVRPALQRLPRMFQPVLSWLGLACIVVGAVVITSSAQFPAPWAAVPVAGSALIVIAGVGAPARFLWPLTNPVSCYVGDISYSLYLWHYPVIILVGALWVGEGPLRDLSLLGILVVLAVMSFHLIEDPIRRSDWLERRRPGRRRVRYRDYFDTRTRTRTRLGAMSLLAVVSLGMAGLATAYRLAPPGYVAAADIAAEPGSAGQSAFHQKLSLQIQQALVAPSFPTLDPAINDLNDNKAPQWDTCGYVQPGTDNARCIFGKQTGKVAVVIGDSIAISWLPGLIPALIGLGYEVHAFTEFQCPSADVVIAAKGASVANQRCANDKVYVAQQLKLLRPELIVASDSQHLLGNLLDKATGTAAVTEWTTGDEKAWRSYPPGATVVVLSPPPGSTNLLVCATAVAKPSNCLGSLTQDQIIDQFQAESTAAPAAGAHLIDTRGWFCDTRSGQCPSFIGTTPVFVDGIHLTRQFSGYLEPLLSESIAAVLSKKK